MLKVVAEKAFESILTSGALQFVGGLVENFAPRIGSALDNRKRVQYYFDTGGIPSFNTGITSVEIRESDWTINPIPKEIADRRVEITGPVDRKMVINALNSGANVFMADFEDSNSPTWKNCMEGQVNLRDAVLRTISYASPHNGKYYELNDRTAILFVRPRGLHLKEKNITNNDVPVPASLVDYGLYVYHNAHELLKQGSRPYFYLPKLQDALEAKIWDDVFSYTEGELGLSRATIKATVLVETLPAAFRMDEILFALKEHSAGLNCGRWDYIFSFIKTFKENPTFTLPDRDQVTMSQHFMRCYTQLLVATCHRRGAHAMGGMAAQIPIKNDPIANQEAIQKVKDDKLREVLGGHDGTWVAHPGLVHLAKEVFDENMPRPNQIDRTIDNFNGSITAQDLICVPKGTCTESALRKNIKIGYAYLTAWLAGNGCVPLNNLMEDAATAEISRTQIWQWCKHGVMLDNGKQVTPQYLQEVIHEEIVLGEEPTTNQTKAKQLFTDFCLSEELDDFLTLKAYEEIQ